MLRLTRSLKRGLGVSQVLISRLIGIWDTNPPVSENPVSRELGIHWLVGTLATPNLSMACRSVSNSFDLQIEGRQVRDVCSRQEAGYEAKRNVFSQITKKSEKGRLDLCHLAALSAVLWNSGFGKDRRQDRWTSLPEFVHGAG